MIFEINYRLINIKLFPRLFSKNISFLYKSYFLELPNTENQVSKSESSKVKVLVIRMYKITQVYCVHIHI